MGVVSRQDDVTPLLPPLNKRHRKGEDLAEENQAAARAVHLAVGGDLDDGNWHTDRQVSADLSTILKPSHTLLLPQLRFR